MQVNAGEVYQCKSILRLCEKAIWVIFDNVADRKASGLRFQAMVFVGARDGGEEAVMVMLMMWCGSWW